MRKEASRGRRVRKSVAGAAMGSFTRRTHVCVGLRTKGWSRPALPSYPSTVREAYACDFSGARMAWACVYREFSLYRYAVSDESCWVRTQRMRKAREETLPVFAPLVKQKVLGLGKKSEEHSPPNEAYLLARGSCSGTNKGYAALPISLGITCEETERAHVTSSIIARGFDVRR